MTAPQSAASSELEAPGEIVGWLLVFCLILTIALPANVLYSVGRAIFRIFGTPRHASIVLAGSYSAIFLAVAVYSVVAGAKLWLIKPHAVRFARHYLFAYLAAHIAYFALWLLVDRPPSSLGLAQMGWDHVVGPLPFVALWSSYLEHSKRVRITFTAE
jgi:hypothetical protein